MNHSIILWRRLKNLNVFFCYIVHFQIFFRYFLRYSIQEYTFKTKCQPLEAVYSERFLGKRYSENTKQSYTRTLMPKCGQTYCIFQNTFLQKHFRETVAIPCCCKPTKTAIPDPNFRDLRKWIKYT